MIKTVKALSRNYWRTEYLRHSIILSPLVKRLSFGPQAFLSKATVPSAIDYTLREKNSHYCQKENARVTLSTAVSRNSILKSSEGTNVFEDFGNF